MIPQQLLRLIQELAFMLLTRSLIASSQLPQYLFSCLFSHVFLHSSHGNPTFGATYTSGPLLQPPRVTKLLAQFDPSVAERTLFQRGIDLGILPRMRTQAEDTTLETEQVLIGLLRAATPSRKMAILLSANRTARTLAMTGLKERHPEASADELRRRLADLWLGPELAENAFGPLVCNG